ncbi:MAG: hypothetical protein E7A71_05520 [Enterococcus faecium]|nr:hypothetical protein [Enterococcus faecium]
MKDTKSGRGGVSIFFMVRNSLYEYEYDYSLEENNWLRGYYVRRGNYRSCDTLIFNDEEQNDLTTEEQFNKVASLVFLLGWIY